MVEQSPAAAVDNNSKLVVIDTAKLQVGDALQRSLRGADGVLLLDAGSQVTESIKQRLLDRGIHQVSLSREDADAMFGTPSASPIAAATLRHKHRTAASPGDQRQDPVASSAAKLARPSGKPLKSHLAPRGTEPYDPGFAQRLANQFATTTKSLEAVMKHVAHGAQGDASVLVDVMQSYLHEMEQDLDQVLATVGDLADAKELVQRSLRMATLSMAVGIELSLDAAKISELGTCAIVHDWGQLCLPERLRSISEPFSRQDWDLYKRHPLMTLDILERIGHLSPVVRIAASQVHEMCDGSGYPRGLAHSRIHLYARIVGTVDAYLALNEARRGRPAIVPHDALTLMLYQIPLGRFDVAVIKALLQTVSLFPVGSYIRTKDGHDAVVLRRGPKDYSRPVVQFLRHDNPHSTAEVDAPPIVDLAASPLEIADVLPAPGKKEMRLDRSLMYEVVWDGPEM